MARLGETLKNTVDPHTVPRTVIFCRRKNVVCSVFEFLRQCAKNKRCAAMYHASLTETTKREIYDQFSNPRSHVCCLVATIAFGMVSTKHTCVFKSTVFIVFAQGVDICNIKTVCVYGLPDTISQLYQVITVNITQVL